MKTYRRIYVGLITCLAFFISVSCVGKGLSVHDSTNVGGAILLGAFFGWMLRDCGVGKG